MILLLILLLNSAVQKTLILKTGKEEQILFKHTAGDYATESYKKEMKSWILIKLY